VKQFIKDHFSDCSNEEQFCFSLTCAECGAVWKSTPIRFSKADEQAATEARQIIIRTLYQRERAQAIERAVSEAIHHFSVCPLCHHLVCDHCFIICDDLDMCSTCSVKLQERGETVMEWPTERTGTE